MQELDKYFNIYKFVLDKPFQIIENKKGIKIIIEKTNNLVKVYKKNLNNPLSSIDRILMKGYDYLFEFLEQSNFDFIPNNYTITLKYDMDKKCIYLINIQKNEFIGKYINIINQDIYNLVSDKTQIKLENIYSFPKLDKDQIKQVLEMIYDDTNKNNGKKNINKLLKYVLNIKKINSTNIESYLFKYENKIIPLKLLELEISKKEKSKPNDIYTIIIIDFLMFLNQIEFNKYQLKHNELDNRYVDLMNNLILDFLNKYEMRYENTIFDKPEFMNSDDFDINISQIKNDETKNIIEKSYVNEQIYKILLSAFRKKRRKVYGILTNDLLKQLNLTIDKIYNKISKNISESLLTFEEILNTNYMISSNNNLISSTTGNLSTQFESKDLEKELQDYIENISDDDFQQNKDKELDTDSDKLEKKEFDSDDDGISDVGEIELKEIEEDLEEIEKKYTIYQKDILKLLGNSVDSSMKKIKAKRGIEKINYVLFSGNFWTLQDSKKFKDDKTILIIDNIDDSTDNISNEKFNLLKEFIRLSNPNIIDIISNKCLDYNSLINELEYNIKKFYIYNNRYNEFKIIFENFYFSENIHDYERLDKDEDIIKDLIIKEDNYNEWCNYFHNNSHYLYPQLKKILSVNKDEKI